MLSCPEPSPLADVGSRATLFQPFLSVPALLLALSGGPDSMALLHLARRWASDLPQPPRLEAATVDHALRPGSRTEAETVGRWCADLDIRHHLLVWQGDKPRTRIQERAREARYDLLAACAAGIGAPFVLTAHHQDDQAETVLFRLARGSGLTGLAGMAPMSSRGAVTIGRPLLGLPKAALVGLCVRVGQPFFDDPSNADPRHARARFRAMAAQLAAEGLDAAGLARLAGRAARADVALRRAARELAEACRAAGDTSPLREAPDELVLRYLCGEIESRTGKSPRLDRAESSAARLVGAIRAGAPLHMTLGGLVLRLDKAGKLEFSREERRRGSPGREAR